MRTPPRSRIDPPVTAPHISPAGWRRNYLIVCICFIFTAAFFYELGGSRAALVQGSGRPFHTLSPVDPGGPGLAQKRSAEGHSQKVPLPDCSKDWPGHLRLASPPLEFQWLAVNEKSNDVSLLGPDGAPVPLERLGTLTLLNNTVYKFEAQDFGDYQLLVSGQPVSRFHSGPAHCDCPSELAQFQSRYDCPADLVEQVRKSMVRWPPRSITEGMFFGYNGIPHVLDNRYVVQVAIVKNKVYCKKRNGQACPFSTAEGASEGHLAALARLLSAVLRRVTLPDVMFYYNSADNPLMEHYAFQPTFVVSSTDFHGGELNNQPIPSFYGSNNFGSRRLHGCCCFSDSSHINLSKIPPVLSCRPPVTHRETIQNFHSDLASTLTLLAILGESSRPLANLRLSTLLLLQTCCSQRILFSKKSSRAPTSSPRLLESHGIVVPRWPTLLGA